MFKQKWTIELLNESFVRFIEEHGREPSALEIDSCDYLPSSRQIQRLYGGLPQLREKLGFQNTHFGQGKHRSKIAHEGNTKSRLSEENLKKLLCEKFHEPFVHVEKLIDKEKKVRVDFYVFNPEENFAVDIFVTETFHSLVTHTNHKLNKYSDYKEKLFLVLSSENLKAGDLTVLLSRKKNAIPKNITIIHQEEFLTLVAGIPPYKNPIP